MPSHIDCYLDCASLYSFFAFLHLCKIRPQLASHGVSVDFHPVLLGGVHRASGNEPPWTLPAKAAYMELDIARTARFHGVSGVAQPAFFPASTVMAQRILCYVKATFPQHAFEQTLLSFFRSLWVLPHADISKPDVVRGVLDGLHLYSDAQVDAILAAPAQKEWKDCLTSNTRRVVELGAFGAPWMWVQDGNGKEEPFFGSDRFHFIWEFLGLPWQESGLLPPTSKL
ncbi:unnamed protein product [Mycena citricolor]|uniref:Glutathione S-transferase kappa n=1 Tax=Mycena citricolor TaxID=2018698 RepID=A0AAD2Q692_9AGAR|nr:unnamed protein product [Mycena citricolor]